MLVVTQLYGLVCKYMAFMIALSSMIGFIDGSITLDIAILRHRALTKPLHQNNNKLVFGLVTLQMIISLIIAGTWVVTSFFYANVTNLEILLNVCALIVAFCGTTIVICILYTLYSITRREKIDLSTDSKIRLQKQRYSAKTLMILAAIIMLTVSLQGASMVYLYFQVRSKDFNEGGKRFLEVKRNGDFSVAALMLNTILNVVVLICRCQKMRTFYKNKFCGCVHD